jgi:hypothetical protein
MVKTYNSDSKARVRFIAFPLKEEATLIPRGVALAGLKKQSDIILSIY